MRLIFYELKYEAKRCTMTNHSIVLFNNMGCQANQLALFFQVLHKCKNFTHCFLVFLHRLSWHCMADNWGLVTGFPHHSALANQIPDYNRIQSLPGRMIGYADYNLIIAELTVTHASIDSNTCENPLWRKHTLTQTLN